MSEKKMAPMVQETATTTFHALCLRHADDIVCAAEARAFSSSQSPMQRIRWERSDLALAGVLLAVAVGLVLN